MVKHKQVKPTQYQNFKIDPQIAAREMIFPIKKDGNIVSLLL